MRPRHAGRGQALAVRGAGARRPIGELLLRAGRIAPGQLESVLREQALTGERFGEVLVRQGRLSAPERDVVLVVQRHQQGLPEWLVNVALALALAAAGTASAMAAPRGSPGTARVQVSAQVMPLARLDAGRHPASVQVTARDVERGFVDVPAAAPYALRANVPFGVQVRLVAGWLRSVTIRGFAGDLRAGPEGATFLQPPTVPGRLAGELSYRFELAPGVQPGAHGWPVALAVIVSP